MFDLKFSLLQVKSLWVHQLGLSETHPKVVDMMRLSCVCEHGVDGTPPCLGLVWLDFDRTMKRVWSARALTSMSISRFFDDSEDLMCSVEAI